VVLRVAGGLNCRPVSFGPVFAKATIAAVALMMSLGGCLQTGPADGDPSNEVPSVPSLPELPAKLQWRQLAPAPTPRAEHAAAVLDGKIYSIGGYYINNNIDGVALGPGAVISLASVEVYDIKTDTWSAAPDYPVTLNHEAAAAHDGFVYVFYGSNSYKLDVAKNAWIRITNVPHGSVTAATDPDSGKIYVAASNGRISRYDPKADAYEELPDYPTPRSHVASAFVGGKYYIGNGDKQGHAITTANLEEFDPIANTWTTRAPNPVVRGSTVGTEWYGRFVVLGGQNQSLAMNDPNSTDYIGFGEPAYDDVHAYDPTTDTWTELPPMPHGRHGFGAVTWEGKIYGVAGAPQEGVSGFAELIVLEAVT
jgi:N-acetylneuraminic acid mutarotase